MMLTFFLIEQIGSGVVKICDKNSIAIAQHANFVP